MNRQSDGVKPHGRSLRCVIVDDSPEFLGTAMKYLARADITIVAGASTSADALKCVALMHPDVTVVDINLGAESGFDLAERLASNGPESSPVILISADCEQDFADLIEASPALGFVSKTDLTPEAIWRLVEGNQHCGVITT
jgi:DNA-binding NarL/FixJ family response regulator